MKTELFQHEEVNSILERLVNEQARIFGQRMTGFYVYGSLVWGDFNSETSDIDTLCVLTSEITDEELDRLREMIEKLIMDYPKWKNRLEIHYASENGLRYFKDASFRMGNISPGEPLHIIDVGAEWLDEWYCVQEYAVTLTGPDIRSILPPIKKDEFIKVIKEYAKSFRNRIKDCINSCYSQAYAILTICRALYTVKKGEQISKPGAAEFVMESYPEYKELIRNALIWRQQRDDGSENPGKTYEKTKIFIDAILDKYFNDNYEGKKLIIIPDSFKGSISSKEAADIIEAEARRYLSGEFINIPIADGGEGSVECILASLGGEKVYVTVKSPENQDISAFYGITKDDTAVIEIAESSGITKQTSYCALKATTYGFGQLIKDALDKGCTKVYLCLGGSATTDCGCGMAAALGVRFFDDKGSEFIPVGGTMSDIARIDFDKADARIAMTKFIIMSDVQNLLYGELGAAYVYGPQKGASADELELLDLGLRNVCKVLKETTGVDYAEFKGGGAAGGCGCGCTAFLRADMRSGIEAMLEISAFDEKKKGCSLIITGEGKLDRQSLMGKVLSGIKMHTGDIPIVTFCGKCEIDEAELAKMNITAIEIGKGIPVEESIVNGPRYLKLKAEEYFKTIMKQPDDGTPLEDRLKNYAVK